MQEIKKKLVMPYIAFVGLIFIGILTYLGLTYYSQPEWSNFLFFLCLFFVVTNYTYFTTDFKMSICFKIPFLFIMTLVFGPFWATIITVVAGISLNSFKNFDIIEFSFNQTMVGFVSGVSSLSLFLLFQMSGFSLIVNFFIAGFIYSFTNLLLLTTIIWLDSEDGLSNTNLLFLWELVRGAVISVILGFILYQVYSMYGEITFIIVLVSILLLKNLLFAYFSQHDNFFQLINSFMKVIDAKDHYTVDHCSRVSKYTEDLARACGFTRFEIAKLVQIAKLHDVGKIWIPDTILNKPSRLTYEEFEAIKLHTVKGMELLSDIKIFKNHLPVILHHHEKYDGSGYPYGLKGTEIPLGARLLAVTDAFDVMTHGRVYKAAMAKIEIVEELERCSGQQFDPEIIEILLHLLNHGKYDYLFESV